jgi:hypothetical protein
MSFIVVRIKWIMLVSGILTTSMIYAAIAPEAALNSTFGETLRGPVADIVVRNWGALITLIGAMLIWGAFDPPSRRLALVIAGASKSVFIGLVLAYGQQYLARPLRISIIVDALMVAVFLA